MWTDDSARIQHQAYLLHRAVRPAAAIDAGAACRSAIGADPTLSALPSPELGRLLRAAAILRGDRARRALLRFSRGPGFAGLPAGVRRLVLERVAGAGTEGPELLGLLEVAVANAAFAKLGERSQRAIVEALAARPHDRPLALLFAKLAAHGGFRALSEAERAELVAYLRGPALSAQIAPMRRNRMDLVWLARRRELAQLLASIAKEPEARQADLLRDFLSATSRSICFLSATELNGHALVVFGSPADPRALSYGRRFVLAKDGRAIARASSPDPSAMSGWTRPARDATTTYACTTVQASRRDEWKLIEWLESSHVLDDDVRGRGHLGPTRVGGATAGMVDAALATLLRLISGLRPVELEHGYLRAGRPVAKATALEEEADELLAAFLAS